MRRQGRVRAWICLWAACASVTAGCPGAQTKAPSVPHVTTAAATPPVAATGRAQTTLSAVAAGDMTLELRTAVADATAGVATSDLSEAETAALLARLEPLPALDQRNAPVLRAPSPMPAGPGTIEPIAFVAPSGARVADRPIQAVPPAPPRLEPPQILPIGEVPAEVEIRVRFAEPMIAVER
ncbi:MAG TPA: hypothetical protein VIV58_19055, partial [Kofleriaceae bacterium]